MKIWLPSLCLLLAACSDSTGMGNDLAAIAGEQTVQPMRPGIRPVRIGEAGPGFKACAYTGRVVNIAADGETSLPVRAAPFVEADEVMRLAEGTRLYSCGRSIDQRWQAVVVAPPDAPQTDCGVTVALASPRDYVGPCRSGWVASAFVQLVAG